jgi:hypothetical protein
MKKFNLFILIIWIVIAKSFSQTTYTEKGMDLFYGRTVPQNYLKAVENFEKAVKFGDEEGAYWLSHCYYFGLGVLQDIKKGDELLYKAASDGCVKANIKIALRFAYGRYEYLGDMEYRSWENDIQKACQYVECMALKDNSVAQYIMSLDERLSADERYQWLLRAADGGYPKACFDIGLDYGSKGDYKKSFKYFEKNGLWASGLLAAYYYWGLGVEKDLRKAKQYSKWDKHYGGTINFVNDSLSYFYNDIIKRDTSSLFQKGRDGDVETQLFIARCFDGREITYYRINEDETQALMWYKMAAMNGNAEAQYQLAKIYNCGYCGYPIEKDSIEYCNWLDKSVRQSYVPALIQKVSDYLSQDVKLFSGDIDDLCYKICVKANCIEDVANLNFIIERMMKINSQLSLLLLQKGLALGDIYSMLYLASCYERGVNIPMDKHKAFEIFNMALAKSIDMDEFYYRDKAYYELGRCYQNGIGIERNIDKAIECYRNSYFNESYEELCKLNVVY